MDAKQLRTIADAVFKDKLKKHSFKGSGYTYRRVDKKVSFIYVISTSVSQPRSVFSDIGVVFNDYKELLNLSISPTNLKAIKLENCPFWKRIGSNQFGHKNWTFTDSEKENRSIFEKLLGLFNVSGVEFIKTFENYPHPFVDLTIKDLENDYFRKELGESTFYSPITFAEISIELLKEKGEMQQVKEIQSWIGNYKNKNYKTELQ